MNTNEFNGICRESEVERMANEHADKLKAIEGLSDIRAAIKEWNEYRKKIHELEESESGLSILPPRPKSDIQALKQQFPRASAYLLAESWSCAANFFKASVGKEAVTRIENGEAYDAVIAEMDSKWGKYCEDHIWD